VVALPLTNGFKNLYDRPRPPVGERLAIEGNPSLPSGHALGSVVVIGVLAAVVVLLMRSLALRVLAVVAAAVLVATIGISRLYLAVHWTTDVLAGWFLGGAWLALCVTVLCVARTPTRTPDLLSPAGAVPAGSGRRG
jgi:membrane-associated phospholipid phosphatase